MSFFIVTILRDDKENIPWANMWDLSGGCLEGDESPFECVARKAYEELGIYPTEDCLLGERSIPACFLKVDSLSLWLVS